MESGVTDLETESTEYQFSELRFSKDLFTRVGLPEQIARSTGPAQVKT